MTETPTIGQAPADQLVALAQSARDVANELLRVHDGDDPRVREARETLDAVVARLGEIASRADSPRIVEAIDPADTRSWLIRGLKSLPAAMPRDRKKRAHVDTW